MHTVVGIASGGDWKIRTRRRLNMLRCLSFDECIFSWHLPTRSAFSFPENFCAHRRSVLIEDVTLREMIFEFWVATALALACHGHARAAWQAVGSGYARAAIAAAHSVVADSQNIVWWPHSKTKSQKNIFTPFCCTLHKVSFEEFSSYFCSRKIVASQRRTVFPPFYWYNFSSSRNISSPWSFSAPSV